jgi:prefoldin subunit 5
MNKKIIIASGVALAAIVAGVIFALQNFDSEKVSCNDITSTRAELQSLYDSGVNASVQIYADEKAQADERLSQCLNAKPIDPCADLQSTRDAAVKAFNDIASPQDNAPYAEFQVYFKKRDDAYNNYKKAKDALDQCRAQNPPKADVPYEKSDTKACFTAYDASIESMRSKFESDTQTMRVALKAAFTSLDAREKACHPPKGKEQFTDKTLTQGAVEGRVPEDLVSCQPISENSDPELTTLRNRAAAIPGEIQSAQTSIDNIKKRMSPLQKALTDVDTYIPPESTKTQFEGTLNALRAERKVAIESSLEFYNNMLAKRQTEKTALEKELTDVNAKITARLAQINKENQEKSKKYPTALHQAKPDKCEYYHCHGMICGRPDPAHDSCGQGATTEADVDCKLFLDSYFKAAGAK